MAYNSFKKWMKSYGTSSFDEEVLLAYFLDLSKKYVPSSLWSRYSMLKCTIDIFDKIDIGKYNRLLKFLKKQSTGYRPKKSAVFTKDSISKFLSEATDDLHLCEKIILIFGIAGALRRQEFVDLTVEDVTKLENEDVLLVRINITKNNVPRSFTIAGVLFEICLKYMNLRPVPCKTNRLFLRYVDARCVQQPIGIHTFAAMPKTIATFLNLPNKEDFSGHSFRRTSATLLVDAGADLTTLQRHGGWKSSNVAYGYIAESINNKKKIGDQISSGLNITKNIRIISDVTLPSTSSAAENIPPKHQMICQASKACKAVSFENVKQIETDSAASTSHRISKHSGETSHHSSNVDINMNDKSIGVTDSTTDGIEQKKKRPVYYHPDIGLYTPGLVDDNLNPFLCFIIALLLLITQVIVTQKIHKTLNRATQTED